MRVTWHTLVPMRIVMHVLNMEIAEFGPERERETGTLISATRQSAALIFDQ